MDKNNKIILLWTKIEIWTYFLLCYYMLYVERSKLAKTDKKHVGGLKLHSKRKITQSKNNCLKIFILSLTLKAAGGTKAPP